jgi:hypothetical protein
VVGSGCDPLCRCSRPALGVGRPRHWQCCTARPEFAWDLRTGAARRWPTHRHQSLALVGLTTPDSHYSLRRSVIKASLTLWRSRRRLAHPAGEVVAAWRSTGWRRPAGAVNSVDPLRPGTGANHTGFVPVTGAAVTAARLRLDRSHLRMGACIALSGVRHSGVLDEARACGAVASTAASWSSSASPSRPSPRHRR